jgi:NADPH:quinone reductase-like Zn-dependent oxidoreductase
MAEMMKAVRIHEYGGPEVLRYEDAPRPEPAAGEVLVRVHAVGINPVDWKTREGGMSGRYHDPFPLIMGWDISGVVEAVGANVSRFNVGDEVFGMVNFPSIGSAYAEYVASPETHLAHKPVTIDHIQAASVPLAALTVWQALYEAASLQPGQRLLILGASGGVGHLAVQIAKANGAYVIGAASTDNLDFVREMGADEVLDYTADDFETQLEPVDMVFNIASEALARRALALIKSGGTLISVAGRVDHEQAAERQIKADNILVHTAGDQMEQLAALMADGRLKPVISDVFPLAEAAQAQEVLKNRSVRRGKIVLQVRK